MKTSIKTKLVIGTFAVALGAMSLLPSASYAMRVEALDSTWGKPVKVEEAADGSEVRYFEIMEASKIPGAYDGDRYRVFKVQKDGKIVDYGFAKKKFGE